MIDMLHGPGTHILPLSPLEAATTQRLLSVHLTRPIALDQTLPVESAVARAAAEAVMKQRRKVERVPFSGTPRFVVRRVIAEGGMGVVYHVHDVETGRDVALKTLHIDTRDDDRDNQYHLKEEFRLRAGISHRNLVELFELIVDGENSFFTMELLDGANLTDHVHGKPEGAVERLRDALQQLVHGASALHAAGKLHRDIKPSNVIVTHMGRVVLLDFGLATSFVPSDTGYFDTGEVAGTLPYMSPEQMWGKSLTPASDWYSVGVMLYELLTGQLPFVGDFTRMIPQKEHLLTRAPREVKSATPEPLDRLTMALLHPDPGKRPSGAEILSVLRGSPLLEISRSDHPSIGTPFVGRSAEMEVLRCAFDDLKRGKSAVVRVEGISGMGKTELIRRFLASVRHQGHVLVLRGRCHPQESVPYKAFDRMVDTLSRFLLGLPNVHALLPQHAGALVRLFPVLGRVEALAAAPSVPGGLEPQELRRRGFEAMRELLGRIARDRRLILWMDDLQWGDADSAHLLQEILRGMRNPQGSPLLILLSYRSDDVSRGPLLRALDTHPGEVPPEAVRTIVLKPLDPALAEDLAGRLLGPSAELDPYLAQIVADSDGSPFFISQLSRHVMEHNSRMDGSTSIPLSQFMKERLQRLEDGERRILETVSVAGGPLHRSVALAAAGIGEMGRHDVQRLGQAHLLRIVELDGHPGVETFHDRIREAVLVQLCADERRECHRRLAEALRAQPNPDPEALVEHYLGAGDTHWAGHYAILAGEQASCALAFDQAARMYDRAVELRRDDPERWLLRAKLGEALAHAGRGRPAGAHYAAAAEELSAKLPNDPRIVELRRQAAEQYLRSGHMEEGVATLRKVLDAVELPYPASSRQALLSVLANRTRLWSKGIDSYTQPHRTVSAAELARIDACWSAGLGLAWVDQIRTAAFQAHYMLLALDAGEPTRVARALATEASQLASRGDRGRNQRSDAVMRKAEAVAQRTAEPSVIAFTHLMNGTIAFYRARWKQSLHFCRSAERVLRERCRGVAWETTTSHILSLASLVYLGELAELCTTLPTLLRNARERGDLLAEASLASGLPNMAWLVADQPDEARRQADQAIARWPKGDFQLQHYFDLIARTQIDLYTGNPWRAWDRLQVAWPALKGAFYLRIQNFRVTLQHLRARCAVAAACSLDSALPRFTLRRTRWYRERLRRLAGEDAERLAAEDLPWASALAALIRGSIAAQEDRIGQAASQFGVAAKTLADVDMALYAAAARYQQGRLQPGDAGRELCRASEAWMTGQGIVRPQRLAAMLVPGIMS